MFLRTVFLGISFMAAAAGQSWSFGLAGGGGLTNAFETITTTVGAPGAPQERTYSQSKDYAVGLTIEYRLPWNFSVEADGLFRELHMAFAEVKTNGTITGISPAPVVTYEFPILGKYRFRWPTSKIEPFIEAGPTFRTTGNLNANPSHYGVAAGIGVDLYSRGFDIAPVIRYSRWAHDPAEIFPVSESKSDQLELLLAISRRSRSTSSAPGSRRFSMGLIIGTNLAGDYPSLSSPTTVLEAVPLPGGGYGPGSQPIPATAYQSGANSLIGGLAMEFPLPKNLYLEADALHHPLCRTVRIVISKWGLVEPPRELRDYLGGPRASQIQIRDGQVPALHRRRPSVRSPRELSNYGLNAGAGVETHLGWLKIAPQIRFTRWGPETQAELAPVTRNQILFLTTFLL